MPGPAIIVMGASAGGIEPLTTIVRALPADLAAAVFVVLHMPSDGISVLPAILERAGLLPAAHAVDGEPICRGRIYVAPPDHHLSIQPGRIRVVHGPRENRHRPAIDRLFRSGAQAYGPGVVGVVLSGALNDGTAGLLEIKRAGGTAIVQDPADALYQGMPTSALRYVRVDEVLPASAIGARLSCLVGEEASAAIAVPHPAPRPSERAGPDPTGDVTDTDGVGGTGTVAPSAFVCPECGGTLWALDDSGLIRYRCRVGHAYTEDSLLAHHTATLEAALWTALRTLEEHADLTRRLAERAGENGAYKAAARFEERAGEVSAQAKLIEEALRQMKHASDVEAMVSSQESAAGSSADPGGPQGAHGAS